MNGRKVVLALIDVSSLSRSRQISAFPDIIPKLHSNAGNAEWRVRLLTAGYLQVWTWGSSGLERLGDCVTD
eukprot:5570510-Amphidinium_carterae.1